MDAIEHLQASGARLDPGTNGFEEIAALAKAYISGPGIVEITAIESRGADAGFVNSPQGPRMQGCVSMWIHLTRSKPIEGRLCDLADKVAEAYGAPLFWWGTAIFVIGIFVSVAAELTPDARVGPAPSAGD